MTPESRFANSLTVLPKSHRPLPATHHLQAPSMLCNSQNALRPGGGEGTGVDRGYSLVLQALGLSCWVGRVDAAGSWSSVPGPPSSEVPLLSVLWEGR